MGNQPGYECMHLMPEWRTHARAHPSTHARAMQTISTRSVASNVNTGYRAGGAVADEVKLREAWAAGNSPFKELKAAFDSGTPPPSWAQIEARPVLAEAKAAAMIALAGGGAAGGRDAQAGRAKQRGGEHPRCCTWQQDVAATATGRGGG